MAEAVGMGQGNSVKRWLALGLAALLAACSAVPKAPPKTVETPPVDTGTTGNLPTDLQRHRVALLVPMSGSNAGVGESIANAANMAVLDTGGKTIRVTTYDTSAGAAAAAEKAIAEGNTLILGPLLAEDVRIVAPVGRAAKIPVISFSNDVSVAGQGSWIMGFVPTQSIQRIVTYARGKGITRFAGLVPNGLYGQRASSAMVKAVDGSGGTMVAIQNFDRSPASMQQAVRRLTEASQAEAILIADSGRVAVQLVPMIRKGGGAKAQILGTELWNIEPSLSQNTAMQGAWFASVSDTYYAQLANKYRARFGKAPYRLASLGYDSVLLVTKIAANWKPGQPFPINLLIDSGGFTGIDGAFRFSRDGTGERSLEVQQINPTGFTVISPAPRTFGK